MPSLLIVEKNGNIKEVALKNYDENELYKKAGFKNADGFANQITWSLEIKDVKYNIQLYAKKVGRAGQENKYEFPPPVDNILYFGNCILINKDSDLKLSDWHAIYEHLYGGFEEIGSEDSREDDEDITDVELTKTGYVKDGFIVDDVDDDDDFEDDDESSEFDEETSEDEPKRRKVVKPIKNKIDKKITKKSEKKEMHDDLNDSEPFLNCENELEEEEYV
jgi:hypothetical protein